MKYFYSTIWFIPLFLILGVGCSLQKNNTQNIDPSLTVIPESKIIEQTEPIIKNEKIKDCQTDLSCFQKAAESCQLTRVRNSYTVNNLGINLNFNDYYEIKGSSGEKCLFYIKTNSLTTEYSNEIKQLLLSQGMTENQITEYENAGNKEAALNYNGKDGYCFFDSNIELRNLINHWSENDYSTIDITKISDCQGKLFTNN